MDHTSGYSRDRDDFARSLNSFGMTSPEAMSLHANFFPEKGRNVQVLAFDDGRFAFLETSARDRLELHNFLLRLDAFFLWRLRLFFYNRFFLWWNQTRGGLFNLRRRRWGGRFRRRRLFKLNQIAGSRR